ncbi:MAG: 30S ribosomal protein S20 [Candidatus Dormibacteraceae bacterium]
MANIPSSKKDARTSAVRAAKNRSVKSAVKTRVTRFRRATGGAGSGNADELALAAVSALDRAASKGILHRNNAARRKGRLMRRLNTATAAETAPQPVAAAKPGRSTKTATKTANKATAKTTTPAAKAQKRTKTSK